MTRDRLRLTLGLAIMEHVPGMLHTPKVKRYLTRTILKGYGIRTTTNIKQRDWNIGIQHAIKLRSTRNKAVKIYNTTGLPAHERVNIAYDLC